MACFEPGMNLLTREHLRARELHKAVMASGSRAGHAARTRHFALTRHRYDGGRGLRLEADMAM